MATIQDLGKVAYFNKGVYNSETTYEINDVVSYNGSSYVSLGNDNLGNLPTNTAFWSVVASKGDKGDTGKAFVIEKTYASIEDMVDDYDNMNVDDYVMIQGSIEDEENATLWTKTDTEVSPYKWVYLADFSGASGITGATPNIQIGTVTEGNEPSVTRRAGSTNENPILDFVLKTGATGATGATGNGISGVAKTSTSGLTDTYTISYTSGNSSTFDVHNGKGISSIAKTSSVGLVDTYTITYNDGTTSTFEITNGEDGEVTQEQLDETNEEVKRAEMVYNTLPKVSDEDTEFSLNGTAECPVYEVGLRGNTYQKTTTGKNLFNMLNPRTISLIQSTSRTARVDNNGTLTLLAGTYTLSLPDLVLANNNYDLRVELVGIASIAAVTNKQFTFTIEEEKTLDYLYFALNNNDNANASATFNKIQIESGSTATEYEEFTGGQPSPSPSYPQDIHVVSGENSVKVQNKNLIPLKSEWEFGDISSSTGENVTSDYYIRTKNYIKIKNSTNYYFSTLYSSSGWNILEYDKNKNFIDRVYKPNSYLSNSNCEYIRIAIRHNSPQSTITLDDVINDEVMLELGNQGTTYIEPKIQTFQISLGNLEYCKIGDYEDEFIKNSGKNLVSSKISSYAIGSNGRFASNSDYDMHIAQVIQGETYTATTNDSQFVAGFFTELPTINSTSYNGSRIAQNEKTFTAPITGYVAFRSLAGYTTPMLNEGTTALPYEPYGTGQWYLKKNVEKVVLNGSESNLTSWDTLISTNTLAFRLTSVEGIIHNTDTDLNVPMLSDKFLRSTNSYLYANDIEGFATYNYNLYFRISKSVASTISDLKTWLSSNNVKIYIPLETPTYTLLNNTLQTQLDNLSKAISYQEQTNVSQVNDDLPFVIKMSAIRDLSGIFELIQG